MKTRQLLTFLSDNTAGSHLLFFMPPFFSPPRWDNTQLDDAHRNMLRESQSSAEAAKRDSTSTPPAPAASENSSEVSKVPAVIPEETEAERQERAWAEAEAVSLPNFSDTYSLILAVRRTPRFLCMCLVLRLKSRGFLLV
jgi:hypothetical protein